MPKKIQDQKSNDVSMSKTDTQADSIFVQEDDKLRLIKPENYPKINHARENKRLTDEAILAINEIDYLFEHLTPYYRSEIIEKGIQNLIMRILGLLDYSNIPSDKKLRHTQEYIAKQMVIDGLNYMIKSESPTFRKVLSDTILPFINLINAVHESQHKEKNSLLTKLEIPDIFFDRR